MRSGSALTAAYSIDGATWTTIGVPVTISIPTGIYLGLAVTSHDNSNTATAVFNHIFSTVLPVGWASQDIGTVGLTGTVLCSPDGQFMTSGAGADIWGTADACRYTYQAWNGNCGISALVASQTNTNSWAKAGVMIRSTLDAASANAAVMMTPGNGITFQWRLTSGAISSYTNVGKLVPPYWVQLVRNGNLFTASYSPDGLTWTVLGSPVTIAMPAISYAGLPVTAHTTGSLSSVLIGNVAVQSAVPALPVITSATTATGTNGSAFSYLIAATNGPTAFIASGLPPGLTVNASNGLVSGTPTNTGTFSASIGAINSGGSSSALFTLAILPTPPLAPTGLAATSGNALVSLTWGASTGATRYNVKRSLTSGSGYITIGQTATTSYNDTTVSNWMTYYYAISALNSSVEGNNSAQVGVTPQSPPVSANEMSLASKVVISGSTGTASFKSSVPGHTYCIQYVDSLTAGNWQNYGAPQLGTGGDLQFSIPYDPSVKRRFFRFQIQQ